MTDIYESVRVHLLCKSTICVTLLILTLAYSRNSAAGVQFVLQLKKDAHGINLHKVVTIIQYNYFRNPCLDFST